MNLKKYLISKEIYKTIKELTDEEFRQYTKELSIIRNNNSQVKLLRKIKIEDKLLKKELKKQRIDKGQIRPIYKQIIPTKYRSYIARANKKQILFELTLEQFNILLDGNCIYCNREKANTIDRIDSKQGYTETNSVSCCNHCNTMKWNYSKEEFFSKVKEIYEFNNLNEIL